MVTGCVCVCGNGVFNTVRGREASRMESILNVSYPPRFTEADQKWIVFKGHLHVWRWYIYQAPRATSVEKKKDSRIWRRGGKTTWGDGWWEDMTEVVEGGRGVKGSNMNFTHIHRRKAVLLYWSLLDIQSGTSKYKFEINYTTVFICLLLHTFTPL